LRLWGEPVIEGSIHSPHPCGSPSGSREAARCKNAPGIYVHNK